MTWFVCDTPKHTDKECETFCRIEAAEVLARADQLAHRGFTVNNVWSDNPGDPFLGVTFHTDSDYRKKTRRHISIRDSIVEALQPHSHLEKEPTVPLEKVLDLLARGDELARKNKWDASTVLVFVKVGLETWFEERPDEARDKSH